MDIIDRIMAVGVTEFGHMLALSPESKPTTVILELTATDNKLFNKAILDRINTHVDMVHPIEIHTDAVNFKTYNAGNLMLMQVVNSNASKSTARVSNKTICIDFH